MIEFMQGAIMMSMAASGVFFLKFWFQTKDRLFLWFAVSFFLMSLNRIALAAIETPENKTVFYFVRLLSYLIIVVAIFEKNRPQRKDGP